MDHTHSQPNLHPIGHHPKFVRRSMSPIDFINMPHYQAQVKAKQIHVDFAYVTSPKLNKVSRRKRENVIIKTPRQDTPDLLPVDKFQISNILENSFVKTHNDTSSFDKAMSKFMNEPTTETDFLKVFDEDSYISRNEPQASQQLENARKKILQLEAELEAKNIRISQQSQEIRNADERYSQSLKFTKFYKREWEKARIKLTMQQRKNEDHLRNIKQLNETNRKKSYLLDRLVQKQRKLMRLKQERLLFLELSSDEEEV